MFVVFEIPLPINYIGEKMKKMHPVKTLRVVYALFRTAIATMRLFLLPTVTTS